MQEHRSSLSPSLSQRTVMKGLVGTALALSGISCAAPNAPTATPTAGTTALTAPPTRVPVLGDTIYSYTRHNGPVNAVAWSPEGKRVASGSNDSTVQVWDAPGGGHVFIYRSNAQGVNSVAWSPDGKYIASGSHDTTVQICLA